MIVNYSSLFYYLPYPSWKFLSTSLLTSLQIVLLSELMHTASKKGNNGVARPSYIDNCVKVKYPLCIFFTYVQAITQQNESRTHLCN